MHLGVACCLFCVFTGVMPVKGLHSSSQKQAYDSALGEVFLMRDRKGLTSNIVLLFPNSPLNTAEE